MVNYCLTINKELIMNQIKMFKKFDNYFIRWIK